MFVTCLHATFLSVPLDAVSEQEYNRPAGHILRGCHIYFLLLTLYKNAQKCTKIAYLFENTSV